jgi:hypothetical protein
MVKEVNKLPKGKGYKSDKEMKLKKKKIKGARKGKMASHGK